nr:cupin domain-containing protein [Henriciella litoralis]
MACRRAFIADLVAAGRQRRRGANAGAGPSRGPSPHLVVPKSHWQTAESLGAWTLVSCFVAPGFEFAGFELAPDNWRPEV